ncbi:DUF4097 family beta strand repeat-containing protein [Kribbella sp. CA-294648]|uniref:DUF4097 family beta strand repeat-containing protein n=1 Tax=Kribbella sp. CA-294648 TaxID=3239948 RepID=UPI003D8A9FCE
MSDVEGRPAGTMSPERRYGIAISVALILGGVYWALTSLTESTKTSYDVYPVVGSALTIETSSVDVAVEAKDVKEITVNRRVERNALGSDPKDDYDNGRLHIKDTGCGFLSFGCDTDYVVTVPKDLAVTIKTSSGDLKVTELGGTTTLKSSSGKIEANAVSGDLSMDTSSGNLEAAGLSSSSVTGKTSSGNVDLEFRTAPLKVDAKSSSGDVTVLLPTGAETYRVDADTKSGDEVAKVKVDPAATRIITLESSSGDTTVEYDR